jgi:hypothetical protein
VTVKSAAASNKAEGGDQGGVGGVDNKLFAVLVCLLAFFAGIYLMRWMRKRTEKNEK